MICHPSALGLARAAEIFPKPSISSYLPFYPLFSPQALPRNGGLYEKKLCRGNRRNHRETLETQAETPPISA